MLRIALHRDQLRTLVSVNGIRVADTERTSRMHTVELLEESLSIAQKLGFRIRQEWLGGNGGGACEFGGQKWLFIDNGLDVVEQLAQAIEALRQEPKLEKLKLSTSLERLIRQRKVA